MTDVNIGALTAAVAAVALIDGVSVGRAANALVEAIRAASKAMETAPPADDRDAAWWW